MTRDEMAKLRADLAARVEALRKVGDYQVGAKDARENAEATLALATHLLERMKRD